MKLTVHMEVAKVYNMLSNKLYEHKRAFNAVIQTNKSEHRLKEVVLQTEIRKLKDRILVQDAHMTVLNDDLTGTQGAMLDMRKEMMEIKAANAKLWHELASLKASGVTATQGYTSGKGSLEDWLQQLGIWMQWNEINDDEHKITMALLHLEGGVFTYMSEYATKAVNYRTLDPNKDAQQHLKEICTKTYPTMVSFTEKFHQWATKTNLGHTALIGYIAEHRDKNMRQAMVIWDSLGIADPTTWPEYLNLCLQLESKFRADKAGQRGTVTSSQTPRAPKDPNAMVVD
ncbi:uncharacterized protein LAESUDRAFT_759022 [Laetiporus sulphureus 93-53]|uniref:Uncharacterized protein n=1 Tax=Laetiporus sulphureus 93-53 TaxID=1314785 RepID=A0A165EE78_9APHY|nr:uncharacterized protein LAESUDRAFT_759022 [Laetiporus sulphureus 93-53]KZT06850.1 hypothetical protein LAESUDRAFT_759022 [Laetiporus sulphureus 93-53]